MKILINTAIKPHFCACVDTDERLLDVVFWDTPRQDGEHIYAFFKKHESLLSQITAIGGISGPGGFSSLRVGMLVLNTYRFVYGCEIYTVSADMCMQEYKKNMPAHTVIVLNSFGKKGWIVKENGFVLVDDIAQWVSESSDRLCLDFLPFEKRNGRKNDVEVDTSAFPIMLYRALQKSNSVAAAHPEYGFDVV